MIFMCLESNSGFSVQVNFKVVRRKGRQEKASLSRLNACVPMFVLYLGIFIKYFLYF